MTESFSADWLTLREPFDAAARSPELAEALSSALPARPRLLDLGAGTGSLTRWLGPILGRGQSWTLVDADAELVYRAFATLADRADLVGWQTAWPDARTLVVKAPGGHWRIEGLLADLREAADQLPLEKVDAVVTTALCDLVSTDWVEKVAAGCAEYGLPFYAALNVSGGTRFFPAHPDDVLVRRGFARDQARDKGFGGQALGEAAAHAIAAAFARYGYKVRLAPSPWRIDRRQVAMAHELAIGHAEAAARSLPGARKRIAAWAEMRSRHAEQRRLSLVVPHLDVLALPA